MSEQLSWSQKQSFESSTVPRKKGNMTRRAFLGLGGVAVVSAFLAPQLAWGGVGGGAWGTYGATAYPGSYFGYDAGWSYSSNKKVWLAASCNCTVRRMTELFVEITVDAYVACGGIWSPTWRPDMPDTPTYAYVREENGTWLSSSYWTIDTTYDHNHYVYMTGTGLRVSRRAYDWRCWCGTDIKGLGGSAPGTHSIAEAPQTIPHHPLVDDRYWQGKIVTMRPKSAPNLYLDASGGGLGNGTNINCWSRLDTTNQNWLVLSSAQGRTCFIPVHSGDTPLFADIASNDWGDGDNLHLWSGTGGWNQSFWLHNLGSGYHLIVPECSGCAWDNVAGGTQNGNNVAQYNPYGKWDNANQHWMLEEVFFRARDNTAVNLAGEAELGGTLVVDNPDQRCIPYNYPGTLGMRYCFSWYRGAQEGDCAELVQTGESAAYASTEADGNTFVTCVITAFARYGNTPYKGEVVSSSCYIRTHWNVSYFADGENSPCYVGEAEREVPYHTSAEAREKATKPACDSFEGWYCDEACTVPFQEGSIIEQDINLFGRNRLTLSYAMAHKSSVAVFDRAYFLDKELSIAVPSVDSLLPAPSAHYFGEQVAFARGPSAWYDDMGRVREAACVLGAYAQAEATGELMRTARLTRTTTVYLTWRTPAYDGIALS